jgi:gamma-glutamyl-gamma-aminobutyrate hydrolase PuuD
MNKQPLIAIADGYGVEGVLNKAGSRACAVSEIADFDAIVPYIDGIMLTGGGDVNPERYGEKEHKQTYGVDKRRDALEFYMVERARDLNIPVMGICRGSQVLNVAYGGTLCQELSDRGTPNHWGVDLWVKLATNSRVGRSIGSLCMRTSHYHHQAVETVGDGLRPIAWASDGTIEAIESARGNLHYALGVQFHPEMDYYHSTEAQDIFRHFVRICGNLARRKDQTASERESIVEGMLWQTDHKYTWNYRGGYATTATSYGSDDRDQEDHDAFIAGLEEADRILSDSSAACAAGKCPSVSECSLYDSCYAADVTNLMGGSRPMGSVTQYVKYANAELDSHVDAAIALDNLPYMSEEMTEKAIQKGKRRNGRMKGASK